MDEFDPEAMAEVVVHLLYDMPPDKRVETAELALERVKAKAKQPNSFRASSVDYLSSPGVRYFHEIVKLEARAAYRFIRRIKNNHSEHEAARLLYRQHHSVPGSGYLEHYLSALSEAAPEI